MHVDYLNVTVPEDHSQPVESSLLGVVSAVGATAAYEGLYRLLEGGTFKAASKRGFRLYSASGGFLAALRGYGLMNSYLSSFVGYPHNVSMLHIAHDVPGDSPRELRRVLRQARSSSGVRLTRKKLSPSKQVKSIMSLDDKGRETGTVYLGTRKSEVWAKVYDKRHERLQNAGVETPATTRYELSVSGKAGASLRDVDSPEAMFWHFMSEVLDRPEGVADWCPAGEGFSLPSTVSLLPAEALRRQLEDSAALQQWFDLVDRIGPEGYRFFLRLVHERFAAHSNQPVDLLRDTVRANPGSGR